MSTGLRDQRCEIFAYSDTGTDGIPNTTYTRVASAMPDGMWACRVVAANASEASIAANSDHQVDVVIAFADRYAGPPSIPTDGVIRQGTTFYKVNGHRDARVSGPGEQVVTAVYASQEIYDSVLTP